MLNIMNVTPTLTLTCLATASWQARVCGAIGMENPDRIGVSGDRDCLPRCGLGEFHRMLSLSGVQKGIAFWTARTEDDPGSGLLGCVRLCHMLIFLPGGVR